MDPILFSSQYRSLEGLRGLENLERPGGMLPQSSVSQTDQAGQTFSEILTDSIREVNSVQNSADQAIQNLATGKTGNVHETLLEMQKAELSMKMLLEVRNKVIGAYEEVMRLQV